MIRAALCALVLAAGSSQLLAQRGPASPAAVPPSPQASAAIDLTGMWVAIVNEDWRWRMVTPPAGDFPGIPLNEQGRKLAMAWDPATDGSCRAFGAAGLMRMPTRVRITWEDERTLTLETDNGQQTRRFLFGSRGPAGQRSLQGTSLAEWKRTMPPSNPFGISGPVPPPSPPGGALRVVTTNLRGGWLRRNGVPYSENTVVTEHFDRFPGPDGSEWFAVTTVVEDPTYLVGRHITSSHFRREADAAKWSPKPCKTP